MTIEEILYNTKSIASTYAMLDDDFYKIARRIYQSDNDVYIKILKRLNTNMATYSIPAGTEIKYIKQNFITYELYDIIR